MKDVNEMVVVVVYLRGSIVDGTAKEKEKEEEEAKKERLSCLPARINSHPSSKTFGS